MIELSATSALPSTPPFAPAVPSSPTTGPGAASADSGGKGACFALLPPEEVPLYFNLPPAGTRVTSFLVDLLVLGAIIAVVAVGAAMAGLGAGDGYLAAFLHLALFLLRNFYFVFFELRWQGRTPGKRVTRTRVVARDGGPLTAGMVFARNLTREVEFFLPVALIVAPQLMLPDSAPVPVRLVCMVWVVALLLFPLFNKARCRVGDLLAGTLAVAAPEAALLSDMAEKKDAAGEIEELGLTRAQLDVYGVRELQVLEDILRRDAPDRHLFDAIARRISRKLRIDLDSLGMDSETFLRKMYRVQRKRLEEKMLMGKRQERKRS